MKSPAELRQTARNALRGNWGAALLAGLIASCLGASGFSIPSISTNENASSNSSQIEGLDKLLENEQTRGIFIGVFVSLLLIALLAAVAISFVASVIRVGYCKYNLELTDWQTPPSLGTLFGHFKHWKTAVATIYLRALYVYLWSLLFFIPGIIASYSYCMAEYLLAENPSLTATQALSLSKEMMYGNRWRLFCLELSFLGWSLLNVLTLGVGSLWLNPYIEAAHAAFFRDIYGHHPRA